MAKCKRTGKCLSDKYRFSWREVPFLLERSAVSLGEKCRFSRREIPCNCYSGCCFQKVKKKKVMAAKQRMVMPCATSEQKFRKLKGK